MQRTTYNSTGRRVEKDRVIMDNLVAHALDLTTDVEDLLTLDFPNIVRIKQLNSHIEDLNNAKRDFRRVHGQLKASLGDAFSERYPGYEGLLESLDTQLKGAWVRLDEIEIQNTKTQYEDGSREKNMQERTCSTSVQPCYPS